MFWSQNIVTIVILNIVSSSSCLSNNIQLLKDYAQWNHITIFLLISCETDNETIQIESTDYLQRHGLWTNAWNISTTVASLTNLNYGKFFDRYSNSPGVVMNLQCNQTKSFLEEISKRQLFHNERKWLMFSESLEAAFDILKHQNINVDAEISLVIPVAQNFYDIYEVYNPSYNRGGRLNITRNGYWIANMSWNTLNQTKIERRHDLNGITFPTVVPLGNIPENKTFLEHLNSNEFVHLDSMSRYMYRLFGLMMEMFNFKMNLRLTHSYAPKDNSGKWHGAVGAINRSEVDFCVTGLKWANARYGVYEQTTTAYYAQFLFIFRHPRSVDSLNVFLTPFDLTVWSAILALILCSAFVVRELFRVENHLKVRIYVNKSTRHENSFSSSILMVLGFLFQQGYEGKPSLVSSRLLTTTMLLFSVLIFQFYSSFIVGSLLTESPKNIKTVKQLLNSRFAFGIDTVPYVLDNFHDATEESTVKLYKKIMINPEKALMPLQNGLNLLKKGGFVFITDDMLTDSEKCDLQDIFYYFAKLPVSLPLPNKSPFRELIKISILKFSEHGILSYYRKDWYGVRPKCEVSQLIVAPVDLTHFSSALFVLAAGMLASTIILVLEVVFSYSSRKRATRSRVRSQIQSFIL